jgi:hypothetical protein
MLTQVDYELINDRIKKIEDSVEMLRKLFEGGEKPMETRYTFITDGDCRWYLLPVELVGDFYETLENGGEDYYAEFSNKFGDYACDNPSNYTFEKPKGY